MPTQGKHSLHLSEFRFPPGSVYMGMYHRGCQKEGLETQGSRVCVILWDGLGVGMGDGTAAELFI